MKNLFHTILFLLCVANLATAQNFNIQPYLQDASPHSIFILWETNTGDESIVEWGLTNTLGNTATGTTDTIENNSIIHTVQLVGLERFTKYFYSVKTDAAASEIFSFKTPPFASDHETFRIIAMSDMQRDGSFPDKYSEIIHDGILDYLDEKFGGELIDNLALVLIPGDLVANGNEHSTWKEHFFNPSEDLFNQIPVYPVLGNHEENSTYYFQYFKLPENGTTDFEEHWWYKDYGNTRIIGLDSNNPFANPEQLDWLQTLLDNTCASDSIDFVFAQLHHPFKSELWTPGESSYTGEVVEKLEQFSTDCGKPSIHFFGHTHAYSRGHSRDHKHLWINAATAGGAIDNWGEFPNADYEEFAVSEDDYGFVVVEITADADPTITIKRINRGDQDIIINNTITDSIVMRKNTSLVDSPTPLSPINEEIIPECVTLKAGGFSSPNTSAIHGQSHWQVSTDQNDFSQPTAESWKNFENWYFEENTQLGDDLTDEKVMGLSEFSTYWWRVRYRDRELNWGEWSAPAIFTTGESIALPNLLLNGGAEDSLTQWTIIEGVMESLSDGLCDGISPHSGNKYFIVGGLCEHSEVGKGIQNIDVSSFADSIDTGNFLANFGGYLSNFSGQDLPEMRLIFLDQNNMELGATNVLSTLNPNWTMLSQSVNIPELTRTIQFELKGTRNAGEDNDSYFDDLFLTVGTSNINCGGTSPISNPSISFVPTLQISPNPIQSEAYIFLPNSNYTEVKLHLINANGSKIKCPVKYESNKIFIKKGNLTAGTYFFWVRSKGRIIGKGKFVLIEN